MKRRWLVFACVSVVVAGAAQVLPISSAAGDPSDGKPSAPAAPGTARVSKGPIKVEVVLKGTVEAAGMTEVSLRPLAWATPMVVREAVEHGTPVKKGDVLLRLDTEKMDQTLRDLRAERELAEVTIRQAEKELPVLEKSLPLDLAAAERANAQAQEDLQRYLSIGRPLMQEEAAMAMKSANYYLESAQEELKQLQKMYRNKDLTEETEEFILKRHRRAVEQAEFSLKEAKIRNEEHLKVRMPRLDQTTKETAAKAALAWDKAREALPLSVQQKRLALAKQKFEQAKAAEKLAQLEKDRESFTVRAPADGVAYHGKCLRGQWSTAAAVAAKLQAGGVVAPEEVLYTIVAPRPVFVRAAVEEKDLHLVAAGHKGKATPTGLPDMRLPCRVTAVSAVPHAGGTFDARLAAEGEAPAALAAGMSCTVKLVPYSKDDALTIPTAALADEESEPGSGYVHMSGENGFHIKRAVKLGRTVGDRVEVLEGLKEGEVVVLGKGAAKAGEKAVDKAPGKPAGGSKP